MTCGSFIPAAVGAAWLAAVAAAPAHGLATAPVDGGAGVRAAYDDDAPVSFADVQIFAPGGSTQAVLTGVTDRNGCFMFRPDTAGVWKVSIDDGMGHASTVDVASEGTAAPVAGSARIPRRYGVVTGLAVIFGVFGWSAYLRTRVARG